MAQEIRLGSSTSMKNINLGTKELQEVYLGATLIWRNNVPPFYTVDLNGTVVSTNGTILSPVKPPKPNEVPSNNFYYNSNLNIGISNIQEEDQPTGNIIFNLYEGNFEDDDTLPVIATFTTTSGGSGTFTVPQGPQPTGGTAADFIYTDKLFSITATDSEEGVSIQFLKVTRIDNVDQWNSSGWTTISQGSPYPYSSQSYCSVACSGACYDTEGSQIVSGLTTVSGNRRDDQQTRTNTYQINGVQDSNPPTEPPTSQTVTRTLSSNTSGCNGTVTTCTNPNYVAPRTTVTKQRSYSTTSPVVGVCVIGPANGSACGSTLQDCTQNDGTQTTVTTRSFFNQPQNCASEDIGSPTANGSTTTTTSAACSYSYPNPAYVPPAYINNASFTVTNSGAGTGNEILQFGMTAGFDSPLKDDGVVFLLRSIVSFNTSWSCSDGTAGSFTRSINVADAGCGASCDGITSISGDSSIRLTPDPAPGAVCSGTFNAVPGSYSSYDGGNVAGSYPGTFSWVEND